MKIKRRIPNFIYGVEETEHNVNSKEELLELEWVQNLKRANRWMGLYYSSNGESENDYLMSLVRTKDGKVLYFVVGFIYGDGKDLGLTDYKTMIDP